MGKSDDSTLLAKIKEDLKDKSSRVIFKVYCSFCERSSNGGRFAQSYYKQTQKRCESREAEINNKFGIYDDLQKPKIQADDGDNKSKTKGRREFFDEQRAIVEKENNKYVSKIRAENLKK